MYEYVSLFLFYCLYYLNYWLDLEYSKLYIALIKNGDICRRACNTYPFQCTTPELNIKHKHQRTVHSYTYHQDTEWPNYKHVYDYKNVFQKCCFRIRVYQDIKHLSHPGALAVHKSVQKTNILGINIYQPAAPLHGPLAKYVKLRVAHAPGMPGTFSLATDSKGKR